MNKKGLLIAGIFLIFLINSVYATFNVSLSDQGTNAKYKSNGSVINLGDLEVTVYDNLTVGNLIYNETFVGVINNGSWNVMLGENSTNNLSLEFGKVYYKDYKINGQDLNFTDFSGDTLGRRFFYSPLGDVGGEDISPISNLTIASLNVSGLLYANDSSFGIGTSSPQGLFNVNGSSYVYFDNADNLAALRLRRFGAITGANANVIGVIQGRAPDSLGAETAFAEIGLLATDITDTLERGALVFKTIESGTFKEQMRIIYNGSVGIGTNDPTSKLHINDTVTSLRIESNDPSHKDQAALVIGGKWGDSTAAYASLVLGSDGATNPLDDTYRLQVFDGTAWKVPLLLYKNGDIALSATAGGVTPIMYLNDTSGYVGIGTTSQAYLLEIAKNETAMNVSGNLYVNSTNVGIGIASPEGRLHLASSNAANPAYIDMYDDGGVFPQLYIRKSDNDAIGTKSTTDSNDWLGAIYFQGVDSGGNFDYGAYIAAQQDGAAGSFVPTNIIISTWSVTGQNQNQLVLHNDGNVGINTTTPTHTLNVVGDLNVTGTSYLGDLIIDADNITVNNIISKDGNISFHNSTNAEIVRFVDDGKIGIGTANPAYSLEIANSATAMNVSGLLYANSTNVGIGTSSTNVTLEIQTATINKTVLRLKSTAADSFPSIHFVNDARDWRIYAPDGSQADAFTIYDASAPGTRFAIDTNGDVGIGTPTPDAKLEIETSAINDAVFKLKSTAANSYPTIHLVNDVQEWKIFSPDGSQGDAFIIYDATAPGTRFAIDTNGDVGIGIANPDTKLEIETSATNDAVFQLKSTAADSYPNIRFVNDVQEWRIYAPDGSQGDNFIISDPVAGSRFAITPKGNIGIGTIYPAYRLEIAKNETALNVSGLLYANSTNVGIGTKNSAYKLDVNGDTNIADGYAYRQEGTWVVGISSNTLFVGGGLGGGGYLSLGANAHRQMVIKTGGNVGIGITTATPLGTLHVNSSSNTLIAIDAQTASSSQLGFYKDKSLKWAISSPASSDNLAFNNGADRVILQGDGNVGIASSTPAYLLEIGNNETALNVSGLLYANSTNVGIGTTTPTHTLNVVGDLNVTGTSYLGDLIIDADNITVNNIVSKDGNISFHNSTNAEIVRFDDNGKVGIGTVSPASILDVRQSVNGGTATLRIENTYALAGSTDETVDIQGRFSDTSSLSEYAFRLLGIKEGDYSAAANMDASLAISVALNGGYNEAIRILSSGRVGIGNSTPSDTLEVQGGVTANGAFTSDVADDGGVTVHQTVGGGGGIAYNIRTSNGGGWAWRFVDGTATSPSNEYFKVTYSSGNTWVKGILQVAGTGDSAINGSLGIGTANPAYSLEIANSATALNVSGLLYANSTNVGIGTANPDSKLEIAGNLNVSAGGNISVAGCITFSTGGQICGA